MTFICCVLYSFVGLLLVCMLSLFGQLMEQKMFRDVLFCVTKVFAIVAAWILGVASILYMVTN